MGEHTMVLHGYLALGFVALLPLGCGDRVLGGTSDGSAGGASGATPGGGGPCASYRQGSLERPGMSAADYCAVFQAFCGFGAITSAQAGYESLADCQTKYGAETEEQRSCSAGHVCEAQPSPTLTAAMRAMHCLDAVTTCANP
jgi:hypothetical protein